jgi:hypothetical protein
MSLLVSAAADITARIAALTARRVMLDPRAILDRSDELTPAREQRLSPNGSCKLVRAADGWLAINLPRTVDWEFTSALVGCATRLDSWSEIEEAVAAMPIARVIAQATLLGMAVAAVAETTADAPVCTYGRSCSPSGGPGDVIDLSALWAGPLCGSVLAAMGMPVIKVESHSRRDPIGFTTPKLEARLNGAKRRIVIDFHDPAAREQLRRAMVTASVVISSARARAFDALDLKPEDILADNPGLIWVAITGHGWHGDAGMRVAFGDDAAVAGGLVSWNGAGEPAFMGDAVADPLTGLTAAAAALVALQRGGGAFIDVALARTAAAIARQSTALRLQMT